MKYNFGWKCMMFNDGCVPARFILSSHYLLHQINMQQFYTNVLILSVSTCEIEFQSGIH